MTFKVQDVTKQVVLDYIDAIDSTTLPIWEKVVLDRETVVPMLFNGNYARDRQAYAMYIDGVVKGYAVVHKDGELDLLHIQKDVRGLGYGERFLSQLDIESVSVDGNNTAAVGLYNKLGYEISFLEDE